MTPTEIAEAVADALRTVPDPVLRYRAARDAEPLMKAALAKVARATVNEMWDAGKRGAEIAAALGVSRQRVEQMVSADRLGKVRAERLANREEQLKQQMAKVRSAKRKVTNAAQGAA
jgi:hypothetical protein